MTAVPGPNPDPVAAAGTTEGHLSFAPRRLGPGDQWRFVLRRLYPRASDPIRGALVRTLMVSAYFALAGFMIASLTDGRLPLGPTTLLGGALGVIPIARFFRVRRILLAPLGLDENYTVGIGSEGLTVASATRVLLIRWPGVKGVFVTHHEVVVTLVSPDVLSIPISAFHGDGYLIGFVQAIQGRTTPTPGDRAT